MAVMDDQRLMLRPAGWSLEDARIEAYLTALPGTFRRSPDAPWVLVVPASDVARVRDAADGTIPPGTQYTLVWVHGDRVELEPGWNATAWGRAQRVLSWLFELGPWRVAAAGRDIGVVRSVAELYERRWFDVDVADTTDSPPRAGVLTTLRRYLGDPDGEFMNDVVAIHSSGACSYTEVSSSGLRRWEGRMMPALSAHWNALVDAAELEAPTAEGPFEDRVTIRVERPDSSRERTIDAARPPETLAELVHLISRWTDAMREGRQPDDFEPIRAYG